MSGQGSLQMPRADKRRAAREGQEEGRVRAEEDWGGSQGTSSLPHFRLEVRSCGLAWARSQEVGAGGFGYGSLSPLLPPLTLQHLQICVH